jgi:3-oxoacyl-[acyl-carrier protein] reductase
MFKGLDGKIALVTGSSRGIGKAIAISLAEHGCNIVVNYARRDDKAREVVEHITALGREALCIKADISNAADVQQMEQQVFDTFSHIDILVNNAGLHQHLKSWELSLNDWNRIIAVNLTGTFLCCKEFIPHFKKERQGTIINISSAAAFIGSNHECHYVSSKAGIIGLTKSLALELAHYVVRVNAVAPGFIETDMLSFENEHEKDMVRQTIPIKRIGSAEDIAYTVCFLASDLASYITGQTIHVNGGLTFR